MLRLQTKIGVYVLTLVLAFGTKVWCKCADSIIKVNGEVDGGNRALVATAEVYPKSGRSTPTAVVKDHRFELELNFDTFQNEDGRGEEYCGRTPESVVIVLKDGTRELSRTRLDIRRDFVRDEKTWDYTLRQKLKIRIPGQGE